MEFLKDLELRLEDMLRDVREQLGTSPPPTEPPPPPAEYPNEPRMRDGIFIVPQSWAVITFYVWHRGTQKTPIQVAWSNGYLDLRPLEFPALINLQLQSGPTVAIWLNERKDFDRPPVDSLNTYDVWMLSGSWPTFLPQKDFEQDSSNPQKWRRKGYGIQLPPSGGGDGGLPIGMDGDNTFLWKPISEGDGNLVVLTPAKYTIDSVMYAGEKATKRDRANGNRQHWRFKRPGSAYPSNDYLIATGGPHTGRWKIVNTGTRYETQDDPEIVSAPPPSEPTPPSSTDYHPGPALMLSGGGPIAGGWGYPNPLWIVKRDYSGKNCMVQCNPIDQGTNMDPQWNARQAKNNNCLGVYIDCEAGLSGNGFDPEWHVRMRGACDQYGLLLACGPKLLGAHYLEGRQGRPWSPAQYAQHFQRVAHMLIEWDYNKGHATIQNILGWYNTLRRNGFKGQYIPMVLHPKGESSSSPWLPEAAGHQLIKDLWQQRLYIGHFYPQYEQNGRTQRWAATCRETYK